MLRLPDSPLGSLLVQHTATALDAADSVASLQGELGTAVSADVQHGKTFDRACVGRAARTAGAGTLGGDLVAFARHIGGDIARVVQFGGVQVVLEWCGWVLRKSWPSRWLLIVVMRFVSLLPIQSLEWLQRNSGGERC